MVEHAAHIRSVKGSSPLAAKMGKRIVLVTGASTGIGRECALRLAADGCTVFGGVRRAEDGQALSRDARGSLSPLLLDVTDEASIDSAVGVLGQSVGAEDSFALVNNAGITVAGPLEILPTSELRRQFDVNFFGPLALTRALLPLLRAHAGRILFMGSLFGRLALPFVAPYTAAKFALAAVCDSLSIELRQWRICVVLVEPGGVGTPLWSRAKSSVLASVENAPAEVLQLYWPALKSFEKVTDGYAGNGIPPGRVASVVARALRARTPRRRYLVGADAKFLGRLAPLLPARLRQWLVARATLRR